MEENVFPGCVVGFLSNKTQPTVLAFGRQTYDPASPPLHENSIFDVASITKAIPTSCLALQAWTQGKLRLDDRVTKYIPETANSAKTSAGPSPSHPDCQLQLPAVLIQRQGCKGVLNAILTTELVDKPGSTFFYSNATSILLGMIVEKIREECLAVSAQREFFDPLGMASTSFFPEDFQRTKLFQRKLIHGGAARYRAKCTTKARGCSGRSWWRVRRDCFPRFRTFCVF